MTNKRIKDPIPENASREEVARFWDTHDIADYWDELEPVKVKVAKNLKHIFSVRFEGKTLSDLDTVAEKKGLGTGALIRMWIKERLELETEHPNT
jgi:hypothetical protein